MKKLISANDVKAAAKEGQKQLAVDSNTIITMAAKDMAREVGIEFTTEIQAVSKPGVSYASPENDRSQDCRENSIDPEMIFQVVKAVLSKGLLTSVPVSSLEQAFQTESDPLSGLKVVRGRTVKFKSLDTGNPNTQAAYRELISEDPSQRKAGFLTIEKSSFEWELSHEEIEIVLEGSLSLNINGKIIHAHQGDVLFIPKNTKVTWNSQDYVKLFYAAYPAH
ncbi:ethanolamine utilization protein [Desulfosporosinus orientis DSM 765]|uniref:Ethanolamine utilization protein n=1 Tax=Desulfosporosinus orientis (strain ATCC 19365 / DSM 765 / NCIMB 8382 / VKM B-1628 / Singapore I) TaxID=768706 RepID=G7WEH3_DESOD|nr:cupin domain-containing protein [Desulfosporosinus orientis]AET70786.1 ethanolamine utilization protein [Desulfosporosinus orientis DSM 765]